MTFAEKLRLYIGAEGNRGGSKGSFHFTVEGGEHWPERKSRIIDVGEDFISLQDHDSEFVVTYPLANFVFMENWPKREPSPQTYRGIPIGEIG